MQKETEARKTNTAEEERKKYAENKRRYQELDILYKKLYESFARGIIAEEKFTMLSSSYEEEQKKLLADIQIYEKSLEEQQESRCDLDSFYELVDKYTSFEELTTKMLNEFVEKVLVHKAEKLDGRRTQKVEVYLNFIGCVEFPAPEKTAEELKQEEIDKFWRDKYQRTREYELARRKKQIAKANEILDAQEEAEKERMIQEFSNEVKRVELENMPVIPERLMNTGTQNNATSNY